MSKDPYYRHPTPAQVQETELEISLSFEHLKTGGCVGAGQPRNFALGVSCVRLCHDGTQFPEAHMQEVVRRHTNLVMIDPTS